MFMITSSNGNVFPRYWPFMRGIHRSPVDSLHKDQWRGALMLSLICAWTNDWVNNGDTGDLRRHRAHYDVIETLKLSLLVVVLLVSRIHAIHLPIFFKVASLAQGQSCDCPSASKISLKNLDKIGRYQPTTKPWQPGANRMYIWGECILHQNQWLCSRGALCDFQID